MPHSSAWLLALIALCPVVPAATTRDAAPANALRAANPDLLSSGVFAALDATGAFGTSPRETHAVRAGITDLSKGQPAAVLDPRVAANVRVGDDPAGLSSAQLNQAEPQLARSLVNPNLLLATFQEGRFADGGAADCGYGVSTDGGFTWRRALIPQLTTVTGGPYNRATDPVAAVGPEGTLYLNTLGSLSGAFDTAAVVVSRSTDNGATWSAPAEVYKSTTAQISPDKNWMAVNDFAGTPHYGRVVVTWTSFTSNAAGSSTGNNLMAAYSDDRGVSWSAPVAITPTGAVNQGSQPVFLPDGSLVVVYSTFPSATSVATFNLDCKRSTDGGQTFPATSNSIATNNASWDDPDLRDGIFLSAATVARQAGDIFVTYTAVLNGTPRVLVTHSGTQGVTWDAPAVASDNPVGVSVVNPAITVTPDARRVAVVFVDKRNAADAHNYVDTYCAESVDGGASWLPNLRLSDFTTDLRLGTATSRGYMLGDYLGVAPSAGLGANGNWQPCVAIWCDTRTGDADPQTARFVLSGSPGFETWQQAYFNPGEDAAVTADPDADGATNGLEFLLATNPRQADAGEPVALSGTTGAGARAALAVRSGYKSTVRFQAVSAADASTGFTATADSGAAPAIVPPVGLAWAAATLATSSPLSVTASSTTLTGSVTTAATVNTTSRLINVATRGVVAADNPMIVGFVIDGPKTMLVRAAGPALTAYGVSGVLARPVLAFSPTSGTPVTLATAATTQQSASVAARVGAFPFADASTDLALVTALPTDGYTAVVSGANGGAGAALVEAYDADPSPGAPGGPRVLNLSTRGPVGASADAALVAGFVITGTQPRRVLIRAVGPTLTSFRVSGILADPQVALVRTGTSVPIATNDDWQVSRSAAAIAAVAERVGAFALPAGSLDAALLITLPPGGYTASVTGVGGTTGIALVEVYDAD